MQLVGKVLWWNDRDGFGIIEDASGNEYYFDSSVTLLKSNQVIKRKSIVTFELNKSVSDCLCAMKIRVPTAAEVKRIRSQFEKQSQLSLFA